MSIYDWGKFGFHIPEIMIPKDGTDYGKWAVVACDQYTSEPEYWEDAEKIVGDAPSTLRLMLPEIYLEKEGEAKKIAKSEKPWQDTWRMERFRNYQRDVCSYTERQRAEAV